MLSAPRLFADLLSSMPLCFNLFATASAEDAGARVRAWWRSAPVGSVTTRFEHSPGRREPLFLGNRSAFDVAFGIDAPDGASAVIGVETKYHEHAKREKAPAAAALRRYTEITERSMLFSRSWEDHILGTELQQIWLDHLLLLSMLQHPSKRWTWGRLVPVYPRENPSFARAAAKYEALLVDGTTFEARTLEELVDAPGAVDAKTSQALRDRYLAGRQQSSSTPALRRSSSSASSTVRPNCGGGRRARRNTLLVTLNALGLLRQLRPVLQGQR